MVKVAVEAGNHLTLHELSRPDYDRVRDLYEPLRFHLSSFAVLDGVNPGKVFVDDPAEPQSSYMYSPEACYLVGNPHNDAFNRALNMAIFSRAAIGGDDSAPSFVLSTEAWANQLATICAPRSPLFQLRRHYVCRRVALDWRAALPDGFSVQMIDDGLLDNPTLPDQISGWISNNWGSADYFSANAFGAATLHGSTIVSWSVADCVSGTGCEIGIHTDPAYRRRGLAAITAARAVDYALSHGFSAVGWQCADDNAGSFRTAEKVGFELERRYADYYMFLDEAEHLAETAYIALKAGRFQDCADLCEQVFALRADMPDTIYHMAARAWAAVGNSDKALAYLNEAADRHWPHRAYTESCAEFELLQGLPQWAAILDRMSANEG
jgi:RimJ/RimL family protein N-acetyltransferase